MHTNLKDITEREQKCDFSVNFHILIVKLVSDLTFCVRKLTLPLIVFLHLT